MQRVNMMGGPAVLSPRYEIAGILLNPEIPADAFRLQERPRATAPSANSRRGSRTLPLPLVTLLAGLYLIWS
jgi:hypothetical protein